MDAEVSLARIYAKNQFVWFVGNRDLNGGLTLGAKATWASGFPHRGIFCPGGFPDAANGKQGSCVTQETEGASFRQIDLSLIKAFKFGTQSFTTQLDIFYIFNTKNYNGYDDFIGVIPPSGSRANAQGGDNLGWGAPNSIRGDPRTVRLMLGYNW